MVAKGKEIRIRLLGDFGVAVDGREVAADRWPGRRAAELVQLLSLSSGHRLVRDQAIEALWPHLPAEAGAANLRKAAHHARRALDDPDAVVLRDGQVSLFPSCARQTDVADFEAAAERASTRGDAAAARAIAATYAGDLLPAARYEEWALAPRQRLRSRYGALLRLAGQWERLVEVEPTDEPAYRELMLAALGAGRRHGAIAWYGRLRTVLRDELGVLPGPETEAVYDQCVAGLLTDETRFVGRQVEVALLAARLRAHGASEVVVVAIRGQAGIGKSALCRQAAGLAQGEQWREVTAVAQLSAGPYATLAVVIDQLVAFDQGVLDAVGERARTVLAELTSTVAPAAPPEAPVSRHQVMGAMRRLLAAARGVGGIVVIVDDAHLADEATVDVLLHLGRPGPVPILIVLAYRPEPASDGLRKGVARLARSGWATELDLQPLDDLDAAALAGTVGAVDHESVEEIVGLAEGSPFFVLELARSAVAGAPLRVGVTRRDAVAVRFADLDDITSVWLRRMALAAIDLDLADVEALTGASGDDVFALLDTSLAAGVLVVVDGRYRFCHELVRQALVDQLPPHQRIAAHRDAAHRLADADAAPGLVARHWLDGQRADLAIPWLLIAARDAARLGASADALGYLEPLLRHRADHPEALLLRAEALDASGDQRAPAAYAAAARAAGEPAAHEIRPRQALAQIKRGDPAGALRTLESVAPVTLEGRLAEALTLSGAAALGFGDPGRGAAKAAESRRLALDSGDPAAVVVASWAQAAAAHARGELRGSVSADLYDTHALPKLAVSVFDGQLCITQRLLYGARPYAEVIAFADSLGAEAERLGAARGQAFAVTLRGEANLLAGRLDEAESDLVAGGRLHRAIAAPTGEAFALQRRAEVALHRGRHAAALMLLDDALAVAQESDVGFHLLDRIYGTRITAAAGPDAGLAALEDAEAAVRGPAETCPGCRITLAVPAAIAAARAGDLDRAARYERASEYLATVVMRLPAWYAALDEVRGHVALAAGDSSAGARHFAAAAETYGAAGHPLDHARCQTLAG